MSELGLLARFLRWLSNLLWPGDYDRDSAKQAYSDYLASNDVERLDAAIERFLLAVDQYRKHKSSPFVRTLINYAVVVRRRYDDCGQSLEDLDNVICLNTEAYDSWSGQKDTNAFVVLLKALAEAYFEQYRRAFGPSPIRHEERQQAFDNAVKYYTELKNNHASTDQKSSTRIQLGTVFRARCELENTLDCFEIGIDHLQNALMEATIAGKEVDAGDEGNEAKQDKKKAINDIKATCLLNLADSYDLRYALEKDSRRLHDLTLAIDRNTEAKALLQAGHPELPACLYNLARQLWLRWMRNNEQTDYDTAKEVAQAAQKMEHADERLKQDIEKLLGVLKPPSRQGTVESRDMYTVGAPSRQGTMYEASDNLQIPQRRGTFTSLDMHTVGAPPRQGTMHEASDNVQIPRRRGTITGLDTVSEPLG